MMFGPEVSPICCRIGENEYVRILLSAMDKWIVFGLYSIFTKEELDVTIEALHLSAEFGDPDSVDIARSAEHKVKEYSGLML